MGRSMMNALTVLLVYLAAVNAASVHYHRGKTVVYKYYADVKAGIIEPAPYASQFVLEGVLYVRHDTSDPTLKNAYHVTLTDVKSGLYNGHAVHHERLHTVHPIVEAAKVIQDPFLIVYNEEGKLHGVKMLESESAWSKNLKQGIASLIQLDLSHINVQPVLKPQAFITTEKTIHGTCQVAYNVHAKDQAHPDSSNVFVVNKLHEPRNCSHFVQRVFDHVECKKCHVEPEDAMTTATRRVVEVENTDGELIIKKLIGHSVINYFPWQARTEAHYLLTNQTLIYDRVEPIAETYVAQVNFQNVPLNRDLTFNKPQGNYAIHAGEDLTQGRHIVKLDVLIPKLKKMLAEAADYVEENHLEVKQLDWKHGQTLNRLLHTMSYMDLGSLEQVYNVIQDAKTPRDVTIKNIFLGMVPHVGTTASCLFTRNVIRNRKVSNVSAIAMLNWLPMHVKVPSEQLLLKMEELLKLDESVSLEVRKASILCFSTLIHKTYQHHQREVQNPLLDRYLQHFFDHVKNNQTYHMKMVYLMAIKNVGVGNIHKLLEPIIRGELSVSEKPHNIRVQAIWAIKDAVVEDRRYTHELLWPVLADTTLPLPVRIVAYDVLMSQLPHMGRMMNMYWFMVYEKNEHLYNYHVTNIKGLANSVDPCLRPVREMARKILRFTRDRRIPGELSERILVDYVDPKYEHGEAVSTAFVLNEHTGLPHIGSIEHFTSTARKPVSQIGIYWNVNGLTQIIGMINKDVLFGGAVEAVINENVKNVLNRAAQDMPRKEDIHIDVCVTMNGHVILMNHYDKNNWQTIFDDVKQWQKHITDAKLNWQNVVYENLYEMQVPTDLGLPAVLATRIPHLTSLKLNTVLAETKVPLNLKVDADVRVWRHGEHVMSIYNPIADVWHAIRRVTVQDVAWPVKLNIGYNHEAKSLKVSLPRLPVSKFSIGGMLTRSKNYVTITEDEADMLKKSCDTCHHHEVVTDRSTVKKHYQSTIESKDTGLQLHTNMFDCEKDVTPVTRIMEWLNVLSAEHKNTWGSKIVQYVMGVRQQLRNELISTESGSCGTLVKVSPSVVHPASTVDVNMRVNVEDFDHIHDTLHVLSSRKLNFRSTVDVKAAATNTSARLWDLNMHVDLSQGHVNNNMKVLVTRITPGEKNLKICIDAQKNYPVVDVDPGKVETTKDETMGKMTIMAGETDEDKCVRDDAVVTITMKGEMSDEQKKHMNTDPVHIACLKDMQNPQLQTQNGQVPKTYNCIQRAVRYSTLRKYTINVSHKKVPQTVWSNIYMLQDILRATFLPYVKYTAAHVDPGTIKVSTEYKVDTNRADLSVITPHVSYDLLEMPIGDPTWNILMDNTHFSIPNLYKYTNDMIKTCTVYPQVLITLDNGTLPFVVSDQWTLISGDHVDQTFAVFVKSVPDNKLATKVFVGGHELEIVPSDVKPVTVNGNIVKHYEKGVVVPADEPESYAIKMTKNNEHLFVQSKRVPVMLFCTPNSVSVVLDTNLQASVTGMCGHMDYTHKEKIPKIYTTTHL
ncbi:hypothetical protein KM043_008778 [Ampulex compressa]|nr:hypothetical protein KM043_008778 [Ampulex compressa]